MILIVTLVYCFLPLLKNTIVLWSLGDYNPKPAYIITPRTAFVNRSGLNVSYVIAARASNHYTILISQVNFASGCSDVKCIDDSGFPAAVTAAQSSDLVVYVGGISHIIEGEGNDRSNISLPGLQSDLISMYTFFKTDKAL